GDAAPTDPPNRLVYLLDHEYTARSLSWSRLKGPDARRAAALRAAAAQAGREVVLALADVHETWSCMGPEWEQPWYGRSGRGRWDWDEDPDEEDVWPGEQSLADRDEYQLEELVDWNV